MVASFAKVTLSSDPVLQVSVLLDQDWVPASKSAVTDPLPEVTLVEQRTTTAALVSRCDLTEDLYQFSHIDEPRKSAQQSLEDGASRPTGTDDVQHCRPLSRDRIRQVPALIRSH